MTVTVYVCKNCGKENEKSSKCPYCGGECYAVAEDELVR